MAQIKPFNGYRYRLAQPQDLGRFIAPPYDMLDNSMIDDLYNKDPHNTVRITQNRPEPTDTCNRDRHERAASFFRNWVEKGVLVRDDEPSVYVYQQKFESKIGNESMTFERTGVVILIKLEEFENGVVLPHEYTLSGPKIDRYELLDATRVNTGQLFGLLSDDGDAYRIIKSMISGEPDGFTVDQNGVHHKLYRCSDREKIEKLIEAVKNRTVLIADGHHRYETALKFYRDHGSDERYAYTMMTLVSMSDPGLLIRPFHRLIKKTGTGVASMKNSLSGFFNVTELGGIKAETVYDFLSGKTDYGMLYVDSESGSISALSLSSEGENFLKQAERERSDTWKHLDVSVVNLIAVRGILGLPLDGKVLHDVVDYVNDPAEGLLKLKNAQEYYGGFFIRPVSIGTIHSIVEGGERMPQKSTNFYPKLYSGLVFNSLEDR